MGSSWGRIKNMLKIRALKKYSLRLVPHKREVKLGYWFQNSFKSIGKHYWFVEQGRSKWCAFLANCFLSITTLASYRREKMSAHKRPAPHLALQQHSTHFASLFPGSLLPRKCSSWPAHLNCITTFYSCCQVPPMLIRGTTTQVLTYWRPHHIRKHRFSSIALLFPTR